MRARLRTLLEHPIAGGCGTPISSLASLIGAQLDRREGGSAGPFWLSILPASFALLALLVLYGLAVLRHSIP